MITKNYPSRISRKQILLLSIPVFFSNLAIPLVGMVDTGLMGNLGESKFLAATSVAASVMTMIIWSFAFLRMGTVGIVAQLFAKSDYREISKTLLRNFLFEIISMTVFPTAIAKGLPPKVDPWVPGVIPTATFLFIRTAPIGKPPPIPFAIGTISGFIPDCSKAKKSEDLPIPSCTESAMRSIFFLLQSFLNSLKQKSGITLIPPSPIIFSTMIAAVFLVIFFFNDL